MLGSSLIRLRPGFSGPVFALAGACIVFGILSRNFLTLGNLSLILQQVMVVGVIAAGQTLIVLTAGIDLSCGMLMALGAMVMGFAAANLGFPPMLAILAGLVVTTGVGLIHGLLVARIRLPPFIVTLGTLNIAFALTQLSTGSQTLTELPEPLLLAGETFTLAGTPLALGSLLMVFLIGASHYVLLHTASGRHLHATGDDLESARLLGIPTDRVLIGAYSMAGLFYGLASWLSLGRTGVADPNAGQTENLDAITAVVLGGTSLFGGRGSMVGTLMGTLIVGVLRNGLILLGISSLYQVLITGVLVIVAVSLDPQARRGSQ